ncbi:MAG: hypothetical protein AAF921_13615 [Cyanobacteria bacterium P01_D01_bin.44]
MPRCKGNCEYVEYKADLSTLTITLRDGKDYFVADSRCPRPKNSPKKKLQDAIKNLEEDSGFISKCNDRYCNDCSVENLKVPANLKDEETNPKSIVKASWPESHVIKNAAGNDEIITCEYSADGEYTLTTKTWSKKCWPVARKDEMMIGDEIQIIANHKISGDQLEKISKILSPSVQI